MLWNPGTSIRSPSLLANTSLNGRPDKVIKTAEGWKILDFKFSKSDITARPMSFR